MSRFTPEVVFETEFEGDKVRFVLRRMKNRHMLALAPYFNPADSGLVKSVKIIEGGKEVIKECVKSVDGLKDEQGAAIGLDVIVDEMYFAGLLDKVVAKLIQVSVVQEEDAKKSVEPPPVAT